MMREGECNQCGECCKEVMAGSSEGFMLDETGVCKYLSLDGEIYICLITAGKFETPAAKEPEIPQEDYDYWLAECQPYPDPNNEDHLSPNYELPTTCSFRMVKKIG